MKAYNLFQFDPIKLGTGEIDPTKVIPMRYTPIEQNNIGVVLVDQNKDLSNSRRFLSAYTTKASINKVSQVLNLSFIEFLPPPIVLDTINPVTNATVVIGPTGTVIPTTIPPVTRGSLSAGDRIQVMSTQISEFLAAGKEEAWITEYYLVPSGPGYIEFQGITIEEFMTAADGLLSSDTILSLESKYRY